MGGNGGKVWQETAKSGKVGGKGGNLTPPPQPSAGKGQWGQDRSAVVKVQLALSGAV